MKLQAPVIDDLFPLYNTDATFDCTYFATGIKTQTAQFSVIFLSYYNQQ